MDVIFRILVSGTPSELSELRAVHGLAEEQVEHARHYARLRDEAHKASRRDADERARNNPTPTEDETRLGCYAENLEPQVRDAVFALQKKGYATIASGFDGIGESQHAHFAEPQDPSILPASLVDSLAGRGIRLRLNPRGDKLVFDTDANLSLDELRTVWKEITDALPDLERAAEASTIPAAEGFRSRTEKPQG